MIAEILSRTFIEAWIEPVKQQLREAIESEGDSDGELAYALGGLEQVQAGGLQGQHDEPAIGAWEPGDQPDLDERSFFSRGPVMSLLQSSIEQRIEEARRDLIETFEELSDNRDAPAVTHRHLALSPNRTTLLGDFHPADFRWVAIAGLAKALTKYRGKHAFNEKPATSVGLAKYARIVMVGDWGSGLRRAQEVAGYMGDAIQDGLDAGRQVHALHLGDVYYAGFPEEYRSRFLAHWPVREDQASRVLSWSLNGNHDMYYGGWGYFDTLLADARFANQEGSSWFRIENEWWRIIGLDTAWDEEGLVHDVRNERGLADPQARILKQWAAEDDRPFMLLSHHPLFSAYDKTPGTFLSTQLEPLLTQKRIASWFWGHEHKCIIYLDHEGQDVQHARCVGHGGVPVYAVKFPEHTQPPKPEDPIIDWIEQRYVKEGPENWAYFGFAILDFDGPRVTVRYIDQYGDEAHVESFTA